MLTPFHIAVQVRDIQEARHFYTGVLGCSDQLQQHQVHFVVEPYVRFRGQPGEQATMFLLDPSGNALEFKAFHDIAGQLFAT